MQEFDDIHNKKIAKRYGKHENKRLSKRKDRESDLLVQVQDLSNWMLKTDFWILMYCRLFISLTCFVA